MCFRGHVNLPPQAWENHRATRYDAVGIFTQSICCRLSVFARAEWSLHGVLDAGLGSTIWSCSFLRPPCKMLLRRAPLPLAKSPPAAGCPCACTQETAATNSVCCLRPLRAGWWCWGWERAGASPPSCAFVSPLPAYLLCITHASRALHNSCCQAKAGYCIRQRTWEVFATCWFMIDGRRRAYATLAKRLEVLYKPYGCSLCKSLACSSFIRATNSNRECREVESRLMGKELYRRLGCMPK